MSQPAKLRRVFVVDDEPVISSTLAMILCQQGFDATSYTKPCEALHASRDGVLDLLITDVVMPGLSGVDLAIKVKEHRPDCKVLLFSGQAATANLLEEAHSMGHDFELLLKPVHPADLLSKIHALAMC